MYNIILQQFPNLKKKFIYVNRLTLQLAKVEETNWKNRDKSEGEILLWNGEKQKEILETRELKQ